MPRILVAGEALMDCIPLPDDAFRPIVGGSPFNVAVAAARQSACGMCRVRKHFELQTDDPPRAGIGVGLADDGGKADAGRPDAGQAAQGRDQFFEVGRGHQNGNCMPGGRFMPAVKAHMRCWVVASAFFIASFSASTSRSSSISLSSIAPSSSITRRTSWPQVIVTLTLPEPAWPSTSTACAG